MLLIIYFRFMAAATIQRSALVFFDPQNEYQQLTQNYDADIFSRFSDKGRCILHMLSYVLNNGSIHFFLPNAEQALLSARNTIFKNTTFYIYCVDPAVVQEMRGIYNHLVLVKIFHIEWLPIYMNQAAIMCLIERAERTRHEPDEHDMALQAAVVFTNELAEELQRHMIVKTGVQAMDLL